VKVITRSNVVFGGSNYVTGKFSAVLGGPNNDVQTSYAVVCGGGYNTWGNVGAVVLGGYGNIEQSAYSVTLGGVMIMVHPRIRSLNERVFEKSHTGAIRFSIRRIEARSIIVSEVCTRYS
jgi:hypothetical protein